MINLRATAARAGAALILLAFASVTNATTYQDWWYNPSLSGMGLNVGQQGQNIFVSWYMYDADGMPSFLLFYGNLQGNSLTAPLRRYFGPEPPGYDESLWYGQVVGDATITFSSPFSGTLDYASDGNQGTYPIQRYTFNPIDINGVYYGGSIVTISNCGPNDGTMAYNDVYTVTHTDDSLEVVEESSGCVYEGTIEQQGTHFQTSGTFTCAAIGQSGTWSGDVDTSENGMTGTVAAQDNFGCQINTRIGGVR